MVSEERRTAEGDRLVVVLAVIFGIGVVGLVVLTALFVLAGG